TFADAGFGEKAVAVSTPCPPLAPAERETRGRNADVVFVSAGKQSLAKGTHVLLEAWRRLKVHGGARLRLVGEMNLPSEVCRSIPPAVEVVPSVPRSEMPTVFQQASVLV